MEQNTHYPLTSFPTLLWIFPLLGIVLAIFVMTHSPPSTGTTQVPPTIARTGQRLLNWEALDFQLQDLTGQNARLSDFRGRPVFINFWATWCEPCKKEFPALDQFAQEQGASGAVVLAVNNDEPPELVEQFLTRNDVQAVSVLLDSGARIGRAYGVINMPVTYIVDTTGVVRFIHLGAMTIQDLHLYLEQLTTSSAAVYRYWTFLNLPIR